jgi:hypothetical protein
MTNTFIPTLSPQPLYCVWIKTGNPSRPLECVWIDPQLRSFEYADVGETTECVNSSSCIPEKDHFSKAIFLPGGQEKEEGD